jgi:hypothetical protein
MVSSYRFRNLKFAWLIFSKRAAFVAHSIVHILQEKSCNYNICSTNYGCRYARAHTPFENQCSWYLNCSKFRRTLVRLAAQYSLEKSQIHNLHEFVRNCEAPHQASTRSDSPINKFKLRKHIHINELVFHIL